MATGAVELEISLFRSSGAGETARYGIELRFSDPASQVDPRQSGRGAGALRSGRAARPQPRPSRVRRVSA